MTMHELRDRLWVAEQGRALAGVLRYRDEALLINAGPRGLALALAGDGIHAVAKVLMSHHRRDVGAELTEILASGAVDLVVPEAERELFENPAAYWQAEESRWRLLCGHVPYHATHVHPYSVAQTVAAGDVLAWHAWRIRVLDTPGYTDGSVTYMVRQDGWEDEVAFTGDLIWGPGQVRDLYSLQHGMTRNGQSVGDYHGFCGSMWDVLGSLDEVTAGAVSHLVPAHGVVIDRPHDAVALLRSRFSTAYHNYVSISALRWYFPTYFADHSVDDTTLPVQQTREFPPCVRRLAGTTWALLADDGHALLIDPCSREAVAAAVAAVATGEVVAYDAIWLTHYHNDHLEGAELAREHFGIPVMTDRVMAEVVAYPERFYLTCLSPLACPVDCPTDDGQTWRWRNLCLTAYHFPGQTYYHSGLFVVPDDGPSLFFAGDAVTPTGIDDYCSWNRNWLGEDLGFERCLKLLRDLDPDIIFNQHVEVGFHFNAAAYDTMLAALAQREELYGALLPYEHANLGTDEYWAHTYPYEQVAAPGATVTVQVRVWNHLQRACYVSAAPVSGDEGLVASSDPLTCLAEPKRECRLLFDFVLPTGRTRDIFIVPFRICFDGIDFGPLREAIIRLAASNPEPEATATCSSHPY